jgi:ABC-type transporter Mla maintaining outer membrane lipid asymmetry permease subunit MlaE
VADTPLQVASQETKPVETLSMVLVLTDASKAFLSHIQDYFYLCVRSLANLATGPRYFQDVLDQMDDIGVGSLPIVLMSGFFIGAVMVLQTGSQFVRFGQTALTGDIVSLLNSGRCWSPSRWTPCAPWAPTRVVNW